MHLDESRIAELGERIADNGLTDRHRKRTREEYRTIFGVEPTPESGEQNLDLIFQRVIQARANPLSPEQYREIENRVSPTEIIEQDTHQEAFNLLYGEDQIGQKIANELLRHIVDVFEIVPEWKADLDVALDTNVVQSLIKTGAIVLDDGEEERGPNRIINMSPDSDPTKLIAYQDVQDAFQNAASEAGFSRIVFDELWLEHREFISDPLLQDRSVFSDLILEQYRYGD